MASPFTIHHEKASLTIPLRQSFRFVHEPLGEAAGALPFVGRDNELESLAERILFSEGGSFLVTGYRGVGKTSFVNQVIQLMNRALPSAEPLLGKVEVVDIHLNVARPVQPSEIMHHIIRRLYDRLVERGIYERLDPELREQLALAYQRTSLNMARKLAESSERSIGLGEASIGGSWMKATLKANWTARRSRSSNHEMTFLGYDDKAAEHDILGISRRLVEGYVPAEAWSGLRRLVRRPPPPRTRLKIIFVFDELDKLEEFNAKSAGGEAAKPVIDHILGALKNLFTTSGVTFVFVAGKDLQERWLEDVGRGDSVYESVFAYDKYLPCLWLDIDTICDSLVDADVRLALPTAQLFKAFKKYLAYRGRGIPRRMIRTFNEYVEWHRDRPSLAFTSQDARRIRFFAGLQELLEAHHATLFGTSHEEIAGTQSDKRRLGVYYLLDWILRQGAREFSLDDVLKASAALSAKIALAQEAAPGVARDIVQMLLAAQYIEPADQYVAQVIGDPAGIETPRFFRVAPRRLVEMGGRAGAPELDASLGDALEDLAGARDQVPTSIGKFRIVREIGHGGMGVVYLGRDEYTGRQVAIKVLQPVLRSDRGAQQRLEREARILERLDHPNLVRLIDWGRADGLLYLAMEMLEGLRLEEVVSRKGPLDVPTALAIGRAAADALGYVHGQGIVRNDVKPDNIMLTDGGRVCLLDFGISRPRDADTPGATRVLTITGMVIGTPRFMAPEQAQGQAVDERADIYALGVVLYRLLTGKYPFDGDATFDLLRAHVEQPPMPPSRYVDLPPNIEEIVLRCLEKEPDHRFQTMAELSAALATAAAALPPVNLVAMVAELRADVREIDMLDQQRTQMAEETSAEPMVGRPPPAPAAATMLATPFPGVARTLTAAAPREEPGAPPPAPAPVSESPGPGRLSGPCLELVGGDAQFVALRRDEAGGAFPLERTTSIGRNSSNDLVLRHASVSRYHALLFPEGAGWYLEDANSSLGTSVNGQRLFGRHALRDGDQVSIGEFEFVFHA